VNRSTNANWAKLVAGTAILSFGLVACGGNSNGNASDSDTSSSAPAPASSSATTATSSAAAPTLQDFKCDANATSATAFKVGGILPATGNLAFLDPPEVAGVGLAVDDINAAGGVNGVQACDQILDSGDSTDLSISTQSANTLVAGKPSVVIGAASSSVSLNVVDTFAKNKIVEVSPANTAIDLSGYSPYYFRTAPPDTVQGNALGTLITQDGYSKIAFIVFNDTYGTGLRDAVQKTVEAAGGSCTYGCTGKGDEFPAGQTTFSTEVQAAMASKPDAIVILAFDETKSIVPTLAQAGWDMSKTYYSDGNTADYSKDFPAGTLKGAQGTIPGADPSADFKGQLNSWATTAAGAALQDYSYGAESYDATILAALAAAKGGANDSTTVQKNFAAVSGATGGQKCTTFADCLALIKAGKDVQYSGPSGIGPINKQNDPSSAFIGIYQFDANNKDILTGTVQGINPAN
jgi:neutral amino acid transport system substrate-binding protein